MYRPYPEFEKDGEFSPSSFVSGIKDRLQGFFQSKEKKRAGARVEGFHKAKKKDWDQFLNHASRKSFVKQLGGDSRSDAKLVMHADNMNRLKTGKKVGTIQGGSKSYSIVKLRGKDRLGCTCNDWRYKRSVAKPGEVVDCKHIRQFKQMNKTAAHKTAAYGGQMQKEAGERIDEVAGLHRLAKAVQEGRDDVPVKILARSELKKMSSIKTAMAAREASSKGMQVGDVILTAMAPEQYSKDSGAPLHKRMKEQFFRKASPAAQGSYTHSAIYVGKGQVVEALQGGVVRRTLKRSLRDLDGAAVVRPKVSTRARRAAAAFAKTQVGAPYESHKFLAKKGFSIFMPKYFDKKLDHGKEPKKTDKWTCSNLIGAAYALQGHATHTRGGRWSMTAPADFLVSDRNAHVKHLGKALGQRPTIGRLKGKTDLADVSEASAKSRTYKDAKKEAMVLWGLDV